MSPVLTGLLAPQLNLGAACCAKNRLAIVRETNFVAVVKRIDLYQVMAQMRGNFVEGRASLFQLNLYVFTLFMQCRANAY